MESELDIIDALGALSYEGNCLQNEVLTNALDAGTRSKEFRRLIAWLTHELHVMRKTDEHVNEEAEPSEFAMELSAMLKELNCPYERLVTGPLSQRFETAESRMQVIEFLITELMATKMLLKIRPKEQALIIEKRESKTARALDQLSRDLNVEKPIEKITSKSLFEQLNLKVEDRLRQVKLSLLNEPILNVGMPLTDEQWDKLDAIHRDLDKEYDLRREMLLTRLEVTIQSFKWADRLKERENDISKRYVQKMAELEALKHGGEDTNIVALLAARTDLAIIEKTSSANVRKNTSCKIQKHVIGSVPDRGGRAHEHAPPPPEMPSWQQQRASGPARGGFSGDRGGGNRGRGSGGGGGGNRGGRGGHWQQHPQGMQHEQQPQYQQRGNGRNWMSGSGRVQGAGWTQQRGNEFDQGDNERRSTGGANFQRGRSNYNRGGGGGYHR